MGFIEIIYIIIVKLTEWIYFWPRFIWRLVNYGCVFKGKEPRDGKARNKILSKSGPN